MYLGSPENFFYGAQPHPNGTQLDWLFYLGWFFYVLNIVEISIDMLLYFRNVKLDKQREKA